MQMLENIPKVHFFGEEEGFRILVLDLLGPSLTDLLAFWNGQARFISEKAS